MDAIGQNATGGDKLLRCADVQRLTALPRSHIYKLLDRGKFPRPVRIGPQTVRWHEREVRQWAEELPRAT